MTSPLNTSSVRRKVSAIRLAVFLVIALLLVYMHVWVRPAYSGQIVDQHQQPIEGAVVAYRWETKDAVGFMHTPTHVQTIREARTDAQGRYTIPGGLMVARNLFVTMHQEGSDDIVVVHRGYTPVRIRYYPDYPYSSSPLPRDKPIQLTALGPQDKPAQLQQLVYFMSDLCMMSMDKPLRTQHMVPELLATEAALGGPLPSPSAFATPCRNF